jgi:oxygen-dependent protoporphyrinogen oxidase
MPHVVIVGGGLSGLSVAYRLTRAAPDISVTVLDPQPRVGGNIVTEDHGGFRVECGPNGFLDSKPFLTRLCVDLGLTERAVPASDASRKNRYLFLGDKLRRLPRGPFSLLTSPLLSLKSKWKILTEPWRKPPPHIDPDETVSQFIARRTTQQVADVFGDAMVTGIHGGDPTMLSVAATFPRLVQMEREAGSIVRGFNRAAKERRANAKATGEKPMPVRMWSFREGLQEIIGAFEHHLGKSLLPGVRVVSIEESAGVTQWEVRGERRSWGADAVVLACPAYEQAAILNDLDPELANEVAAIPYNRIAVVALGYRQQDCPGSQDGFGYIAPQNTRRDVLGVQWCSSIFPDRAPPGSVLWRALCGGVHRAEMVDWDDDTLAKAVHEEIKLAMGVTGEPYFRRIVRWHAAIPQYVVGHVERVARIDSLTTKHAGLFLGGNAYRGVAMSDCAEQGELLAEKVRAYLAGGGNGLGLMSSPSPLAGEGDEGQSPAVG